MILSFCDNGTVLSIFKIIKTFITIIKIVVPIILIISLMINYIKAVSDGDIGKANKNAVPKIIAALLIFLIPTFVNIIARSTSGEVEFMKCIANANSDGINKAYITEAREKIEIVNKTLSIADYNAAKTQVNKIEDETLRKQYQNNLDSILVRIKEKEEQEKNNKNNVPTSVNPTTPNNTTVTVPVGDSNLKYTIFLGDSRTNGMRSKTNSNVDFVIATDGANHTNLPDHFSQAKTILNNNPNTNFNIVLNYGANSPSSINTYCSRYQEFINSISSGHRIFIVSVNPVDDNRSIYLKNDAVVNFNNRIKSCVSANNIKYCDIYNAAPLSTWTNQYISDGVHYNSSGYQFIYSNIKRCIGN